MIIANRFIGGIPEDTLRVVLKRTADSLNVADRKVFSRPLHGPKPRTLSEQGFALALTASIEGDIVGVMSDDKRTSDHADWQVADYEQILRDDADADLVYEEEWAAEVERRNAEIESGEARFLPGPETLAKLKSEFQ